MPFYKTYQRILAGICLLLTLLAIRMVWNGSLHFGFLVWNLFLGLLPLYFSRQVALKSPKRVAYLYAFLWLIFFPNASYLLTDLVHLRRGEGPGFWLDLVILFASGVYGVVMGLMSLQQMETWYGELVPRFFKSVLTFLLLLGCGYGMYLGRVERWNSWDVLLQPIDLMHNIFYHARHPFRSREVWMLSGLFGIGLYLFYLLFSSRRVIN